MKLFYTPNSPYSRIARIAVREAGLERDVEEIPALNRRDDNPVLDFSAVGRVPVLIADGIVITEAKNVVARIAVATNCEDRFGISQVDWHAIEQEGQILGFLEGIAFWVRETRRGALASDELVGVEIKRCERCLAYFNSEASDGKIEPFPVFRSIALACALDLMDFHRFSPEWHSRQTSLSEWSAEMARRPSMQQTRPVL